MMARLLALLALLLGLSVGCTKHSKSAPGIVLTGDGLTVSLSTNVVHVGDPITLELNLTHPAKATVDWPRLGDGKKVVVYDQGIDRASTSNSIARWTLLSYELGQHTIWSGTVAVVNVDGTRAERSLPDLSLHVESILPTAGDQLRGAKGLAHWPHAPLTRFVLILGLVGLLALLVGLLVRWLMGRRDRSAAPPAPIPPHEKALQALADLEKRTDFAQVDPELFFVDLSTIVRHYLEDRFALRAPEQTTEEFIRGAASSQILRLEHQQLVEAFLVECDLVKFARHRPGADRMQQALAAAYRLVRETIPTPPPVAPGGTP